MAADNKALALAAKDRGNAAFAKKSRDSYEEALTAYKEAIEHDPEDHVFHANCCACHSEIGGDEWDPRKKVECYARALEEARKCTTLGPDWAKGYVRQSTAEFDLVAAKAKWEDRKVQDEKWRKEDEERDEKRAAGDAGAPKMPGREKKETEVDPSLISIVDSASHSSCEAACRRGLELEPGNALLRTRLQALRDGGHTTDEAKDKEMRDPAAAAPLKAEGNASFSAKKWTEAAEHYTKALAQDSFDHVFYSNRSACYAEAGEYEKALRDAERCIAINPQFAKGYSRQALALFNVGRYPEMLTAAQAGLAIDASSVPLQDLVKQAEEEVKDPLDVQQKMHSLRQEKRQDAKLQELMRGLNMQGNNVQMFNPGSGGFGGGDLSGLLSGLGGGGGMGGMGGGGGGFGGNGKSRMTDQQMRGMARAMGSATASGGAGASPPPAAAPAPAKAAAPPASADGASGPKSFGPGQ